MFSHGAGGPRPRVRYPVFASEDQKHSLALSPLLPRVARVRTRERYPVPERDRSQSFSRFRASMKRHLRDACLVLTTAHRSELRLRRPQSLVPPPTASSPPLLLMEDPRLGEVRREAVAAAAGEVEEECCPPPPRGWAHRSPSLYYRSWPRQLATWRALRCQLARPLSPRRAST